MSKITDKFVEDLLDSYYWTLSKDFRQYDFQELSREEQFECALRNMDYQKFEKYFERFIDKYCEVDSDFL